MKNKIFSLLLVITVVFSGCFLIKKVDLNDDLIKSYLQAYKNVKKVAPDLAKNGAIDINAAKNSFSKIESEIKAAGMKDFAQFVLVTEAVMWAFSKLQSDKYMSQMDKMTKGDFSDVEGGNNLQNAQSDIETSMREILDNPDIPDETKNQIRAQLASSNKEIKDNMTNIRADFDKNKKWADIILKFVGGQTNDNNLEVVKRHFNEIESAFAGQ